MGERRAPITDDERQQVIGLYEKPGGSIRSVAHETGLSQHVVRRILDDALVLRDVSGPRAMRIPRRMHGRLGTTARNIQAGNVQRDSAAGAQAVVNIETWIRRCLALERCEVSELHRLTLAYCRVRLQEFHRLASWITPDWVEAATARIREQPEDAADIDEAIGAFLGAMQIEDRKRVGRQWTSEPGGMVLYRQYRTWQEAQ